MSTHSLTELLYQRLLLAISEMGEEREELLQAMSIVARDEARKHLSEAGREVLEMMEYTSINAGALCC